MYQSVITCVTLKTSKEWSLHLVLPRKTPQQAFEENVLLTPKVDIINDFLWFACATSWHIGVSFRGPQAIALIAYFIIPRIPRIWSCTKRGLNQQCIEQSIRINLLIPALTSMHLYDHKPKSNGALFTFHFLSLFPRFSPSQSVQRCPS